MRQSCELRLATDSMEIESESFSAQGIHDHGHDRRSRIAESVNSSLKLASSVEANEELWKKKAFGFW
jgi:hypothetical protein